MKAKKVTEALLQKSLEAETKRAEKQKA